MKPKLIYSLKYFIGDFPMREDSEAVEAVQFEGETDDYELSETHVTFVAHSNKNRIRVKFPREEVKFFNGVLLALIE